MERATAAGVEITAVGICVPGISYAKTGRVWAPNIPGWEDYPLRDDIKAALKQLKVGRTKGIPKVRIENDRACYILGEEWKGVARGCRNAVFLAVGTGIGAGLLVNGSVATGAHGTAGSIGWLALQRPFLPEYKKWGCFEHHASGAGIARGGMVLQGKSLSTCGPMTTRDVFDSFDKGERTGRRVIGEAIQFWGMAVANLVTLFDPEMIVFGGGVFGPGLKLLPQIRAEAAKWAQPVAMKDVKLVPSRLRGDAGLYGAARVALTA